VLQALVGSCQRTSHACVPLLARDELVPRRGVDPAVAEVPPLGEDWTDLPGAGEGELLLHPGLRSRIRQVCLTRGDSTCKAIK
jgi:hypothetical protein